YKEDVHSMGDASNALMGLRPVTYRYKQAEADGSKPIQYGLIAEEVDKVMPALVVYDEQGRPDSVSYEILPSLLLNEYQKQNRKLAAAEAKLAATEAEFTETRAALAATRAELAESNAKFEAELAALKLAVSRLAAAPSAVKVAASQP
ncbi:tail fiber domain-containing protein, partial [Aestuariivirga sp.]|uniref:tail fiber domain-containing protein n=1 Tax=Aestuariivirga sp. TaxID=2650926 RepID=UPI0025C39AC3